MNEEHSSDLNRYRHAVASMWRGDEAVGHLYLDAQMWTVTRMPERKFSSLGGHESKPETVERELLAWMVVWSTPQPGLLASVEDVSRDTPALLRELDANKFILWAKTYDLRWIEGSKKKDVLREVFGIDLDGQDET